jgi:hypothetical protein
MRTLTLATVLALALPLAAQQGGSANRAVPKATQGLEFANGCSIEITYRSLTWAQGRFMDRLKTETGRTSTNNNLKANPTGSMTVSKDCTLGGKAVKAGTYKLYFEVDADVAFHLVLENDGGEQTKWKLDLKQGDEMNSRLTLVLTAGKGDTDGSLAVAFGTMAGSLPLSGAAAAANASGEKKGEVR